MSMEIGKVPMGRCQRREITGKLHLGVLLLKLPTGCKTQDVPHAAGHCVLQRTQESGRKTSSFSSLPLPLLLTNPNKSWQERNFQYYKKDNER